MQETAEKLSTIKEYYGKILLSKKDLQSNTCCAPDSFPPYLKVIMKKLHREIIEKFYGCGSPIPPALEDCVVLDLGCGSGRDVYAVSALVGPRGRVIGADMTPEQILVAQKHQKFQAKKFGFSSPNMEFRQGYLEDLEELGLRTVPLRARHIQTG